MKLYYLTENGYYSATSEAFLDPLETELQGKDVWLMPPNATVVQPPTEKDGYKSKFNGEKWVREKIPEPVPVPEPGMEEIKQVKLSEIDNWTASKITGGFISSCNGKSVRYDSDKDTQLTMQGIALNVGSEQFAQQYPDGCPVRGYAAGKTVKSVYLLTPEQLYSWCADLSNHIGRCKQAGWEKQAQVEAALSKEDLDAIILD